MDNEIVKRLMWGGLLAGTGALATIVSTRIATAIWIRIFGRCRRPNVLAARVTSTMITFISSGS